MKVYVLSTSWYEEYEPHILIHERELSAEEFKRMCNEAMVKAAEYLLREESPKEEPFSIRLYEIGEKAVEILMSEYGFQRPDIVEEKYWGEIIGEIAPGYSGEFDWCPKELLEKLVEHNVKVAREMFKEYESPMEREAGDEG